MPRYIGYKPTGTANSSVSITAISPLSPFSADGVLVVAGGGAGGGEPPDPGYYKGGGGAGGYRAFTGVPILTGTSYTVVVGAGGSAVPVSPGSSSSFSGPNLPAPSYTSAGGGHGNQVPWPGGPGAGGSGGGLPGYLTSPIKAGNSPGTSPPQGNPGGIGSTYGAGGGGGAGGAGANGSGNGKGGNGGPGATWPHSGSTYAGGGGGGNGGGDPGSFGAGGPGGGGRGSGGGGGSGGQDADSGTTNTGGGGGGRTREDQASGSGGSGVVIVAVPPSIAPAITGGTPSVAPAPAGGKTLITSTSPNTLTVGTTALQTTVNKKYNSGIWSISGTGTSSVYGRIRAGNWATALVDAPVDNFTVLAVNLTTDASDASGYSPAHTITVSGDTSFAASGANFDGSGDKIRYVGNGGDPFNIAANEDFVIQFELDVDETGPAGPFDTGINVGGIGAFTNGGSSTATKYFRAAPGLFDISVATTWNGTWRIERSGSTITLYKDDVSQGTATYSGAISSAASGSAITLGSHDLNSTYPTYYELDGRIRYFQFRKGTTTVLSAPF